MARINMIILNRKMTMKAFQEYIKEMKIRPWNRKINRIIMHHTSSPLESWQNSASMLHYWRLYESRGWKAGPHLFISKDSVWLFTPIKKQGKASTKGINKGSIHIELVGRYFDKYPGEEVSKMAANVLEVLTHKFNIKTIRSHYSYDENSNCSPLVDFPWVMSLKEKHHADIKITK
jgi:hypothetical protein